MAYSASFLLAAELSDLVCLIMNAVIGQVKLDSLDLKQPINPSIRAVNNQSHQSILLLTIN